MDDVNRETRKIVAAIIVAVCIPFVPFALGLVSKSDTAGLALLSCAGIYLYAHWRVAVLQKQLKEIKNWRANNDRED